MTGAGGPRRAAPVGTGPGRTAGGIGLAAGFGCATAAAFGLSSWLPTPPTFVSGLLRWVAILGVATAVLAGARASIVALLSARRSTLPAGGGLRSALVIGAVAAALGIVLSPSRAITAHDLRFGDPQAFVGGTPFTDDTGGSGGSGGPAGTDRHAASERAGRPGWVVLLDGLRLDRSTGAPDGALASGSDGDAATDPAAPTGTPPDAATDAPPTTLRAGVSPTTASTTTAPPTTAPPTTAPPTTAPPTTAPPRTEPPATAPPATEPPVTAPPTTAPPTTAAPTTTTSTTTTTTTPTTTTTTPTTATTTPTTATTAPPNVPQGDVIRLVAPSTADTTSQPVLRLGIDDPEAIELPNYDIDRDDFPGLTIARSDQHLYSPDPAAVQRFRIPVEERTVVDGHVGVRLWAAARGFEDRWVGAIVAVFDCEGEVCAKIGYGTAWFEGDDDFVELRVDLGWIERAVPAGHEIELRVAALDEGASDLMIAFGTDRFDSRIVLDGCAVGAATGAVRSASGCRPAGT